MLEEKNLLQNDLKPFSNHEEAISSVEIASKLSYLPLLQSESSKKPNIT